MNPVDQWRAIGYEAFRCNEAIISSLAQFGRETEAWGKRPFAQSTKPVLVRRVASSLGEPLLGDAAGHRIGRVENIADVVAHHLPEQVAGCGFVQSVI